MATLQSRLQRLSQKHSAPGSSMQSRLDRLRKRHGKQEEEDEEKGFFSRLYYGEEEGEGGAMGLEEIPGQFVDVVTSPIEKGVKPLVSLGAGAAKLAVGSDEDEDTDLARMAWDEFADSITELPEALRSGHPTEGIMNLASVISLPFTGGAGVASALGKVPKLGAMAKAGERLGRIGRTKGMRGVEIVADPMTGLISGGVALVQQRRAKKKAAAGEGGPASGEGAAGEGVAGGEGPPKERPKSLLEKMRKGDRTLRQTLFENIQGFFLNLSANKINKTFDYLQDPTTHEKRLKAMLEASDNPESAIEGVVQRLAKKLKDKNKAASETYGNRIQAFEKTRAGQGDVPLDPSDPRFDPESSLPVVIGKQLEGFNGRLKAYRMEDVMGEVEVPGVVDGRGNPIYEQRVVGRERGEEIGDITDSAVQQQLREGGIEFEYDVDWHTELGTESPLSPAKQKKARDYIINDLIEVQDGAPTTANRLIRDHRMTKERAEAGPDAEMDEVLANRLHEATVESIETHLNKHGMGEDQEAWRAARVAYRQHKDAQRQAQIDYGRGVEAGFVTPAVRTGLEKKLDSPEGSEQLKALIGEKDMGLLLGAAHSREFGGGLSVRHKAVDTVSGLADIVSAPMKAVIAGAGIGGMTAGGAGALLGAVVAPLAAIPLMAMYSPRQTLPIAGLLSQSPTYLKLVGRNADVKKKSKEDVSRIVKVLRDAREAMARAGRSDEFNRMLKSGVTFGQLMERLQEEEQGRR